MTDQQFPDLSFTTNQRWAIKLAALWTLLMVPSDIAQIKEAQEFEFVLLVLGMVGFFILLFRGLQELVGPDTNMRELARQGMKYPWTLMLGICAWHLFLMLPATIVLFAIFGVPEQ